MRLNEYLIEEKYRYYNNCVNWDKHDVDKSGGLSDMIDSSDDITRNEFLRNVDMNDMRALEQDLGYTRTFKMENDYHVKYYKSKLHGKLVYFFTHSAIEYVFTG